ncbi:MAG: reverse transcriptase family protein, partial [Pseudomonadota bacterium]
FKKADFEVIRRLLAYVCWSQVLSSVSASEALSNFYDIIFAVLSDCVPIVRIRDAKFPYWYTKELINLIKEKEVARRKFIKTGRNKESNDFKVFCSLRSDVKAMQKACHSNYLQQIGTNIKENPKRFWSFVKSQKSSKSLPSVITYNSCEYTSLRDIVKVFCQYFESVFSIDNKTALPPCCAKDVPLFRLPHVSADQIKAILVSIDRYTCSGFDGVPALLLIECAEELCFPLATIFNLSVNTGEYPSLLKCNNVIPIYKQKGDKSHVESYRPISIQPVVSKVFEKIVNRSLRSHISQLICKEQHGFSPKKSTTSNLLCYKDFISSSFDDGFQVHSVYADFHKAFDTVSHELLLLKMSSQFGVTGNDLTWFRSYLSHRYQRVVIGGMESDWVSVSSGVPQGSILGPSLFIMYINDLPSCFLSSECLLFADDVKIFKQISSVNDCFELQNDLNALSDWCSIWSMNLNLAKCFFINFSLKRAFNIAFDYLLDGSTLKCVNEVKDLGIYFSSDLSFALHITTVVNKAFRMLGFVKRTLKPIKCVTVHKVLYNAYIRSCLDYGSAVWSPNAQYLIDKLERVQRRFIKHLCFVGNVNYDRHDYIRLCNQFRLTTLEHRRKVNDLVLFHKVLHSYVDCPYLLSCIYFNLPVRRTRHTKALTTKKKCRLLLRKCDFIPRTLATVNYQYIANVEIFFTVLYQRQ